MSKPPDLAGAIAAMRATARGPHRKSPVYEWLAARHNALAAEFAKQPPSWTALAKYLSDGGIMNADGKPLTPSAVRSSWLRVEADYRRKRDRRPQVALSDEPVTTPSSQEPKPVFNPETVRRDDDGDDPPPTTTPPFTPIQRKN
nr:hypothetical protein [uncultured Rhodopila sp.]